MVNPNNYLVMAIARAASENNDAKAEFNSSMNSLSSEIAEIKTINKTQNEAIKDLKEELGKLKAEIKKLKG